MKAIRVLLTIVLFVGAMASANAQFDFGFEDTRQPWEQFKLNAKTTVKLDFRNASVDAIIHTLSQASGIAIVKDPTLTGGITLQSPKQQKLVDAFAMFNAVLSLKGFDIKKEGNFLVIRSRGQSGRNTGFNMQSMMTMDPSAMGGQSQNSIKVYPLKYASATQVARVVNEVYALQNATTMMSNVGGGGGPMMGGPGGPGGPGMPFAPEDGEDVPGGGQRGGRGLMQIMGQGGMGGMGGMMGGMGGMMGGFQGFGRRGAISGSTVRASADEYSNSVIVNAPTNMQEQIGQLINQLDKETDQPQTSRVFKLEYAAASELTSVVQNVLNYNASRGRGYTGTGNQGGGFNPFSMMGRGGGGNTNVAAGSVVAETRTNSLVVTTISENMAMAEKVIKELDKPVSYENRAFVVTLKNAKADVVSQLLNQSFGNSRGTTSTNRTTTGTGSTRTNNRSTGSTGLGNSSLGRSPAQLQPTGLMPEALGPQDAMQNPEDQQNMQIAQGGMFGLFGQGFGQGGGNTNRQSNSTSTSGFDAQGRRINLRDLAGDMTAIPDVNTNSVIIVTSPQNRELIESILEQLDRIPEQVMIETLIVEASLDATSKLGVEWNFTSGSSTATSNYGLKSDTSQPQGLRYTLTGSQYSVFLNGVKSDSRFEVLSTPRIFTSNNSEAEINISQSLPYVTNQRVDSNGNYSYSYSFMDVGIVLTVTPRITSNGYVTMEVTQTANDFVRYTDFNAPVVNQREAQTTVSVKDGDTVVLGGIIKNSLSSTVNKVPILGDIPIVGSLFRSTNNTNSKTELLVFLTPHVVRDPEEARALRERTQKELQLKTQQRLQKTLEAGELDKPTKEVTPPTPTGGPTVRG